MLGFSVLLWTPRMPAQDESEALEAVRASIADLENRIAARRSEMDADRQALQRLESQIAEQHGVIAQVGRERAAEQERLDELNAAAAQARVALGGEREALSRQVLLSYMTGREELLKLMLNQESPTALGRMVTYYDYFNQFRSERIAAVRGELEELAELLRAARASAARLTDLTRTAEAELASLEAARSERNGVIAAMQTELAQSGQTLESLRADEQRLEALVLELGDILTAFPSGSEEPFAALRGRLAWPAPGEIDGNFGTLRNGGPLRWNGVLLAAEPGTPVRAVYHGRVAFSDWLPGLGLLLIVDHGDGYLSLYGYNEVLLRESGEWVLPGDVLAQVGSAGGRSGLYFELRHEGEPINPNPWMRAAP